MGTEAVRGEGRSLHQSGKGDDQLLVFDAVLQETKSVQRRLRELPSRVGVYFLSTLGTDLARLVGRMEDQEPQ